MPKVKTCKRCGAPVIWIASRYGRLYPVNHRGKDGYRKTDFHKCGKPSRVSGKIER